MPKRSRVRRERGTDHGRRSLMVGAGTLAALTTFNRAHGLVKPQFSAGFLNDRGDADVIRYPHIHEGKGAIDVKFFFRQDRYAHPALLLTYDIPPGASEGVHTHRPGDAVMGSFDEFYYILSGSGVMEIAGKTIAVTAGDHIFTPNEVAHGIENTSDTVPLKVYLVAVIRD